MNEKCLIKISEGDSLAVYSPYAPTLADRAKKLGGKWDGNCWRFDPRMTKDVKALYLDIYGDWPGEPTEYVTLHAEAPNGFSKLQGGIFLAGRCIARAWGRDSGAKIGDGVILREGDAHSGGSMKNWKTCLSDGTVVEIFDVPRDRAERCVNFWARKEDPDWVNVRILEDEKPEEAPAPSREELLAERAALLARLAEINEALGEPDAAKQGDEIDDMSAQRQPPTPKRITKAAALAAAQMALIPGLTATVGTQMNLF